MFDLHGLVSFPDPVSRAEVDDALDRLEGPQHDLEALVGDQAVAVAREVRPDRRSLHLYCDGEGPVPWLMESWSPGRPVTTRWVPDPAWLAVGPFR